MAAQFRAEQVGSFLRPPEVLEAHEAYEAGRMELAKLREIEDHFIMRIIDLEREVGIDVLTDGEYRRAGWASDFPDAVEGYVQGEAPIQLVWHRDENPDAPSTPPPTINTLGLVIGAKLRRRVRLTEHEAGFMKEHAGG